MKKRVLVFPCGSEIGLEVYRALKFSKDFELIGASTFPDHGKFVYENYIEGIPFVDDETFIEEINKLIEREKIDAIIPAHDSVVLKLSQNSSDINAVIVTSSLEACEICRSKKKTYERFKNIINTPKMFQKEEITLSDLPVFLKPDVGQGSKGTKKINTMEDLEYYSKGEDNLLLEYLPYDEYTIDCFTNYKKELVFCAGRKRSRISNGISVNAVQIKDDRFIEIAKKINDTLTMNGAWFFQVKENKNKELVLLEIATRIAGTMDYQRARGINLPLISLYNALQIDVQILENDYNIELDRALENKFRIDFEFNNVYLDLDDTLIVDNKVNYELVAFLYKCLNENKKIYLLTKHKNVVMETLEKYKIYNIFTDIIHITDGGEKYKYINDKNSIFIDDSFSERKNIYINNKIPVFDVNMIDVLL